MNELSDDELRGALDAAGRGPTDESRARLRAALFDDVPRHADAPARRRTGWIVGLTLATAAALVGALFIMASGDDAGVVTGDPTATTDAVAATSIPADTSSSLESVVGRRWILDSVDGEPWTGAIVPFLEPTVSGTAFQADGSDGCNLLDLRGDVVGGRIALSERISTAIACDDIIAAGPRGDEVLELDGSGRLASTDGRLVYRAIDPSGGVGWGDLIGRWRLDGWGPHVEVTERSVRVGSCAMAPTSPNALDLDGWPPNPMDCIGATSPRGAGLLLQLLTSGSARGDLTGGRLVLLGQDVVLQLEKLALSTNQDGIAIEAGSAFGSVPGDAVSVDAELTRIEAVLGPVDHDTDWYDAPRITYSDGTEDCLGGRAYRVLWWGDLSLAFWRGADAQEQLWAWSVGDRRVSLWGDRREPYTPPEGATSGLATETGIAIGTSESDLVATYGDRLARFEPSAEDFGGTVYDSGGKDWPFVASGAGVGSTFLVRDGVVVGFGASLRFC